MSTEFIMKLVMSAPMISALIARHYDVRRIVKKKKAIWPSSLYDHCFLFNEHRLCSFPDLNCPEYDIHYLHESLHP